MRPESFHVSHSRDCKRCRIALPFDTLSDYCQKCREILKAEMRAEIDWSDESIPVIDHINIRLLPQGFVWYSTSTKTVTYSRCAFDNESDCIEDAKQWLIRQREKV